MQNLQEKRGSKWSKGSIWSAFWSESCEFGRVWVHSHRIRARKRSKTTTSSAGTGVDSATRRGYSGRVNPGGGRTRGGRPTELVVETQHLTKIYQNRQIALNDVSLTIEPGCVLGLLGPQRRRQDDLPAARPRPAPAHGRLGEGVRQGDDARTPPTCAAASATSPPTRSSPRG